MRITPCCSAIVAAAIVHLAGALGLTAGEPRVPLARLHDADPKEREIAALLLGAAGEAAAVPLIAESIVRKIEIGNRDAALALAWIGAPALPKLRELLGNADPFVRTEALRALQLMEPAPVTEVAAALPLLKDPNRYVVRNALEFLARCGAAAEPAVPDAVRLLTDRVSGGRAGGLLAAVGAPALPALRAALGDPARALNALRALGAMGAAAAPALAEVSALLDDARLRADAVEAIGGMGAAAAAALPKLVALLGSDDLRASAAAAVAIAAMGAAAKAAAPAVAQAVRRASAPSPGQLWNLEAIDALGVLGDPTTAEALAAVVDDVAAGDARQRALRVLLRIEEAQAVAAPALLRAAIGKDDRLARFALDHAARLPADAPAALAANLARKDLEVACRSAAAILRSDRANAAAIAVLETNLATASAKDAKEAKGREAARTAALAALRLLPDGGWAPDLAPLLTAPGTAKQALAALAELPTLAKANAAAVARHLAGGDRALRTLAAVVAVRTRLPEADAALGLLKTEAAGDGGRAAIQALGQLRTRRDEVLPALRGLLRDPDWKIRVEAENAIARLQEDAP